ncbi:MAG: porin [Leptospiraceae bacterium]|nr:porin [Leptospiraceae bacterium]MCP5513750.1 porin [Leptospiraceae bacterium]
MIFKFQTGNRFYSYFPFSQPGYENLLDKLILKRKTTLFLALVLNALSFLSAQETVETAVKIVEPNEQKEDSEKGKLDYSIFMDSYFLKTNNRLNTDKRSYTTQALNADSVSLNFALVQVGYENDRVRGKLGLHTGTYVESNYAAEPALSKNIYEAFGGYRLAKDVWLDVGIFASHIGMENAISRDNINYTRSLMAENSPYYESGARLSWQATDKLNMKLLLLNGWQVIQDNNKDVSGGTQVTYDFTPKFSLNWSTYVGNDQPNSSRKQMRYFNHFGFTMKLGSSIEVLGAFDVGQQEKAFYSQYKRYNDGDYSLLRETKDDGFNRWTAAALQIRYHINDKLRIGLRGENFLDKNSVIVSTGSPNGFQVAGGSVNIDYQPNDHVLFRIEGKSMNAVDTIFPNNNQFTRNEKIAVTSMSVWF